MAETTRTKILKGLRESVEAASVRVRVAQDAVAATEAASALAADAVATMPVSMSISTRTRLRRECTRTAKVAAKAFKAAQVAERHLASLGRTYNQTVSPPKRKYKKSVIVQETEAHKRQTEAARVKLQIRAEEKDASLPHSQWMRKQAALKAIWKIDPDSPIREKDLDEMDEADWPSPLPKVPVHTPVTVTKPVKPEPEPEPEPELDPEPPAEERAAARRERLFAFEEASALRAKRWQVAGEPERRLLEAEGEAAKRTFDGVEAEIEAEAAEAAVQITQVPRGFLGIPTRRDSEIWPSAEGSMNLDIRGF